MWFNPHGGECCGVTHAHGFGSLEKEDWYSLKERVAQSRKHGHLMEVVVTDRQVMRDKEILPNLKKLGFRHVSRFLNGNSGNYCNVFHFHRNPRSKLDY